MQYELFQHLIQTTLKQLKYNIPCLLKFFTGNSINADAKEEINFTHVKSSTGEKIGIPKIKYGKTKLYDTAMEDRENQNKIDVPGYGACEGTLACSTCTLHFSQEDYDRLGLSEIDDEEQDLLARGVDVRDTFRLGCQVELAKEFEGISILIPEKQVDRCIFYLAR